MESSIGSVWRKWDLHVHTASSYDTKYKGADADQLLCNALHENKISAVAITDHFIIDAERIDRLRKMAPDIVFFPGVELRTDKGADNLHMIIIFSEQCDVQTLSEDFKAIMLREKAQGKGSKDENQTIYWHFEDIINFAKTRNGLITIHAGQKASGIDKEIKNSLAYRQATKREIVDQIDFFEMGKVQDLDNYRKKVFPEIGEKPMIICSDNHDPRNYVTKENLWIKADLTFEGLKQCKHQPQERVYVGTVPPVLDRVNNDPKSNIQWVKVHPIDGVATADKKWFDFDLELNPGLVAVIGNKGNGKSALSDIIGHLCKCRTMESASFLNHTRFCKPPKSYADGYRGEIIWRDANSSSRVLSEPPAVSPIEDAQYLPQKYIEEVCNDIESKFQEEIDQVIFSYIDEADRGTATSLPALIVAKSETLRFEIDNLKKQIKDVNKNIIFLEKKQTSTYRKDIEEGLRQLQNTLERHDKGKPKEVKRPEPKEKDKKYQEELKEIDRHINELELKINETTKEIVQTSNTIDEAQRLIIRLQGIFVDVKSINEQLKLFYSKCPAAEIEYIELSTPEEKIKKLISLLVKKRNSLNTLLDGTEEAIGFKQQLENQYSNKKALIATADKGEREYQKYLQDVERWQKEREHIIGIKEDGKSLAFYQHEKQYLGNKVEQEYENLVIRRNEFLKLIFKCKEALAKIYEDIYQPVEGQIKALLRDLDEGIEFEAEIQLSENDIGERLLGSINQRFAGRFRGKTDASRAMDQLIRSSDFANEAGVLSFTDEILSSIGGPAKKGQSDYFDNLEKIVSDKESFYDLLFNLNYVGVSFKLKWVAVLLNSCRPVNVALFCLYSIWH